MDIDGDQCQDCKHHMFWTEYGQQFEDCRIGHMVTPDGDVCDPPEDCPGFDLKDSLVRMLTTASFLDGQRIEEID